MNDYYDLPMSPEEADERENPATRHDLERAFKTLERRKKAKRQTGKRKPGKSGQKLK